MVEHIIHVGMDITWFVVSSSLESLLLIVKECLHVHYIAGLVHRTSQMPIREKVFDYLIKNKVPLVLECLLNLQSLGVGDFKTWMHFFAHPLACLALKSTSTETTSLVKLVFYILVKCL